MLLPNCANVFLLFIYFCSKKAICMPQSARFITPSEAHDSRGTLRFVQAAQQLPFVPMRAFWITDVPAGAMRGGHAHTSCQEALFVLRGSFTLDITTRQHEQLSCTR